MLSLSLILASAALAASVQDPADAPWRALGLDRAIEWAADDPEEYVDGRRPKRSIEVQVDRAALLDGAIARARDDGRVVMWYVPRIVEEQKHGVQMYRAPVLDLYVQQVLFQDPDVRAIVGSRFVPVRLVCDEALSARFGLRPLEFVEPAVVFVGGDGRRLHHVERLRTFNPAWFTELLRRVLAAAGQGEPRATTVDEAIARGEWEHGLELLEGVEPTPRTSYAKATLLRRLRRAAAAHGALDAAAGDADPVAGARARQRLEANRARLSGEQLAAAVAAAEAAELSGDVATERGLLWTLQGEPARAIPVLRSAWLGAGTRRAEAGYLLAWNLLQLGDEGEAIRRLRVVATEFADDPFGRRARANLELGDDERPLGATFCAFESLAWLPPAAYTGLPADTTWAGGDRTRHDMIVAGVRHLLAMQRSNGGFTDSRYAYWPNPTITPNAWVAITALCATALHAHREIDPQRLPTAEIDAAIDRAERFMFAPHNLNRGRNEDVYADAYRLLFLYHRHTGAGPATRAALVERMNRLLHEAEERQLESGFFAHEYANAFCTAAMLWGVFAAQQAGAEVSPELVSRGVGALLSARTEEGAYVYGGSYRKDGGRAASLKDSAGRMPACEAALLAFGQGSVDALRFAIANFWEHLDRIEQVRRNDFHSDGELAGFFFFHDLFHASEANELLPEDERAANERRFFALLQEIGEMDGSFVDSHEIGRSYGTAMALLVLANL